MSERASRVDMLVEARDAQWSAQTFLGDDVVKLIAPAKVNLFLDVGARRDDGLHDVTTVLHSLSLHDVLYVSCMSDEAGAADVASPVNAPDDEASSDSPRATDWEEEPFLWAAGGPVDNIKVSIDCVDKTGGFDTSAGALEIPARDNIVFKAVDAYAKALNRTQPESVSIRLEKGIPYEAGLGGGSSDAAAALLAMAYFWDEDPQDRTLFAVAHALGCDVPFFLLGGCVLCTGSGSTFDHALRPAKDSVVLVKPSAGVSTKAAYRAFDQMGVLSADDVLDRVRLAQDARDVPRRNNLAEAAESLVGELSDVRTWLAGQPGVSGERDVLLCGSGAATFAVTEDFFAACDIAAQAQALGWWARATTFSSLGAAVLQ